MNITFKTELIGNQYYAEAGKYWGWGETHELAICNMRDNAMIAIFS